jgi:hypothetical protein
MSDEAGTVALLEAIAEARTLIEDLSRLADELKARQDQLGELLAPSEAALRARTEYLDKVMREQLGRAEQRVIRLSEDVERIARSLSDQAVQMPSRLAEADQQREAARTRRERWRIALSLLAMLLGGFLAGMVATWWSAPSAKPAAIEASPKSPPSPGRKPAR